MNFNEMFQFQSLTAPQRPEIDTALTETNPQTPNRTRRNKSPSASAPLAAMIGRRSPTPMSESLIHSIKNRTEAKKAAGTNPEPTYPFDQGPMA
jgi:hypothetical protein